MDYLGYIGLLGLAFKLFKWQLRPKRREESSGPQAALKKIVDYFVGNFRPPKASDFQIYFVSLSSPMTMMSDSNSTGSTRSTSLRVSWLNFV